MGMKALSALALVLGLVLTPLARASAAPASATTCVAGSLAPVLVTGHGAVEHLADDLEARATGLYEVAATYTGASDCAPVEVHLTPDIQAASALLPAWHLPPWAAGAARPGERLVVLTVHSKGQRQDRERVLVHELSHVALAAAAGGAPVPRWFDEGVARRLAGEDVQDDDRVLAESRLSGQMLTLEGLEVAFPGSKSGAAVAYAVSGRAIELLEERYGPDIVRRLLAEVRAGAPFEEALHDLTGLWTWQLSGEVERSVALWHAWLTLIRDVDFAMAAGALLLVVGGLRARRRLRQRIDEMEDPGAPQGPGVVVVRWTVTR